MRIKHIRLHYTIIMKITGAKIATYITVAVAAIVMTAAVALCAVFPNKYANAVNAAADEFRLDRALVRSVIWAESGYDARAVSEKGASGLMQMMPETYEFCASSLGIDKGDIFDTQNSLRCGCFYLALMLDKFDGDETAALMAYNAGEANARKFLAGEQVFAETAAYVKKIGFARKIYGIFS